MLDQAYSPMTIRFFILQAHYRSTVDFSNDALQAAEKGYSRLSDAYARLMKITPAALLPVTSATLYLMQISLLTAICCSSISTSLFIPTMHRTKKTFIITTALFLLPKWVKSWQPF